MYRTIFNLNIKENHENQLFELMKNNLESLEGMILSF